MWCGVRLCRTYDARDFLCDFFLGLPAWAKLCRAYGAGLLIICGTRVFRVR